MRTQGWLAIAMVPALLVGVLLVKGYVATQWHVGAYGAELG
jgi:hypothetical protein